MVQGYDSFSPKILNSLLPTWIVYDLQKNNVLSPCFIQHFQADVQKVQEAIYSAVDVMQAMESSIYMSLSKVFNL